ncbi:hypothetical protein D8M04_19460 [Oceanobacillus piezotolerans]|uniref:TraB/GumN family protein n=1 Tax=Oceanobacillus piezotolerans TaxID=2448030 RepID=A0A498D8V5_9BACI|nr:DUF5694 domain-containing protein [Oceanobacillus piezotolerans]RLL40121.1 hypothetical protein D8M04_19460 [Oceanobacillus piezotolerans]
MKKEIILVGTYHFEQDEELIKKEEKEVKELVDYLAHYKPTKVAVEWEMSKDKELNIEYQNSNGNYSMDEIQQIGFRLAEKLNHDKVYAVNWTGQINQENMMELNDSIQSSYPELLNTMKEISENAPDISLKTPLVNSYRKLNNKEFTKELEKLYLSLVVVTDNKEKKIGLDFLNKWMERELAIFKNILDICNTEDRILLIIGSDHLWMLRKLFEGNGWNVISPFLIE